MIYEPQIHPTHIMMDEEVEKSPLGQKMKNELIERCNRSNTPALWIIENYHRKGYLRGDFAITPKQAQLVQSFLHRKGLPDAQVTTHMLDSGYADGLALEHIAKAVHVMLSEEVVAA
ncbi:hypothetical protein [Aeromonas veronii]|uniref:hypothetical protein n=1 Tax=Aeromonas veronii TaxID=654 RepID=UPI000390F1DB|nr:hypothetical protein [Aeromonas veronii]QMS74746.1 hypothetical protein M001_011455 [Aeromonas veronii Hm21]